MVFNITVEITGDMDEDAMTVDEKVRMLETILTDGCEANCMNWNHLKLEGVMQEEYMKERDKNHTEMLNLMRRRGIQ